VWNIILRKRGKERTSVEYYIEEEREREDQCVILY
jgi:hypothetical protein